MILDLYEPRTIKDHLLSLLSVPSNAFMNAVKNGSRQMDDQERKYWAEHMAQDKYMTLNEIRKTASEVLSGSIIRRHLFWRYSLVWKK